MIDHDGPTAPSKLRVIVADDDTFVTSLVSEGLRSQGFAVATAATTAETWELIARDAPHAVVSDLNFGRGDSAAPLLTRVHDEYPWVGLVVLTSHQSPQLAIHDAGSLPPSVVYVVKTQLKRVEDLKDAVMQSILGVPTAQTPAAAAGTIQITATQAEVLRMLADGASTRAIAEQRGTSIRAAETMLSRLFSALGVGSDDGTNERVVAVQLWQQGRVTVRGPSGRDSFSQ